MQKRTSGIFIIITGILIAIGRILLNDNNSLDLLTVMAIINFIALGFVFLFLVNNLVYNCKRRIDNSGLDSKEKRSRLSMLNFISLIFLTLYLILGILYITKFKANKYNDAISIFALALSIATDNIVDGFTTSIYNMTKKLSSFLKK